MKEVRIIQERCKGCGFCIHFCPRGALGVSAEINEKGYNPVQIDREKCIVCGICYNVCPDYVFEVEKED